MKKTKLSLLAISVLVVGTLAASAATTTYRAYRLDVRCDDNANAKVWSVRGGPQNPVDTIYPHFDYRGGSVDTDGSGKISGVGEWRITYSSTGTPFTTFYGTVSGKLAGKIGSAPTVTMTVKADGYTVDGTNYAKPFKGSFKFTGQAGTTPGNANNPAMVGNITGSASGSTPVDPKGFKLLSGRVAYIDRSGFDYARINADVLQSSTGKMQLFSTSIQGNGSIKDSATYKATVKGAGFDKGVSVSFSGTMGLLNQLVGTNSVTFLAPTTAEVLKGSKLNGQAIQGPASRVTADFIP
jgi:hypothetical protein